MSLPTTVCGKPELDEDVIKELVTMAGNLGFHTEELLFVNQDKK